MPLCCEAQSQQKVLRFRSAAVFCLGDPFTGWLIEMRTYNTGIKSTVFFYLQFLLDMFEVFLEFISSRVSTGPSPVLYYQSASSQ
jgi:hypothetical protein